MKTKSLPVVGNERPDICGPCGGRCCINGPGAASAANFGTTEETVAAELLRRLRTGLWKVDKFAGSMWLRPAHATDPRGVWGEDPLPGLGVCRFWRMRKGCKLTYEERPTICRELKPIATGRCTSSRPLFDKVIDSWLPYHHVIRIVVATIRAEKQAGRAKSQKATPASQLLLLDKGVPT